MKQTTKNKKLRNRLTFSAIVFITACLCLKALDTKYNNKYPYLKETMLNTETTTYQGVVVPDAELFSSLGETLNLKKHKITYNHYYVGLLFITESNELKEALCDEPLFKTIYSGSRYQKQKTIADSCWWLLNKAVVQNKLALITVNKYNYLYGVEVDGKKILDTHQAYSIYKQELENFYPPLPNGESWFICICFCISGSFFVFYLISLLRSKR